MAVTAIQLFTNNAQSTLAGNITNIATTANLASGAGALFPVPSTNEYFLLTFVGAATGLVNEIVKVTAMSGDTITTMVRAQEGTDAVAWSAGDIAGLFPTAGTLAGLTQARGLQTQAGNYAVDSGTANAMVITLSTVPPNLAALQGSAIRVTKAAAANTAAVTINVNGLGAVAVKSIGGAALAGGDLPASSTFTLVYDGTNFVWQGTTSITQAALQLQASNYAVDSGSANAMVAALTPAIAAYTAGLAVRITKSAAANTGATTININALGAKNVFTVAGVALEAGQLPASCTFTAIYDGTQFILQSPLTLTRANLQSQVGNYAADSGTANALVVTLNPVPVSLAALVGAPIRITKGVSANSAAATLAVNGLATKAITDIGLNPLLAGALPALGTFSVVYDGTQYVLQGSAAASGRVALSSNTDFYVATTGNDSNSGLSSGQAWLTLQHAWNTLIAAYDLAGFTATVHVANGTYTGGITAVGTPPGATGSTSIIFASTSGTASACIISTASTCLRVDQGAGFTISNMTLTSSGSNAISVSNGAQVAIDGVIFGAVPGGSVHMFVWNGAQIVATTNYTITGNADRHMDATRNGVIYFNSLTCTLTGTPSFAQQFATALDGGVIYAVGITYSGSALGTRYLASTNGVIQTAGGGATYFPGSIGGSANTGGQYA